MIKIEFQRVNSVKSNSTFSVNVRAKLSLAADQVLEWQQPSWLTVNKQAEITTVIMVFNCHNYLWLCLLLTLISRWSIAWVPSIFVCPHYAIHKTNYSEFSAGRTSVDNWSAFDKECRFSGAHHLLFFSHCRKLSGFCKRWRLVYRLWLFLTCLTLHLFWRHF